MKAPSQHGIDLRRQGTKLVEEEGHGCELSCLQTTMLRCSARIDGGELSNELSTLPLLASRVEEGGNLCRSTTVSGRESKDEAIVLFQGVRSDNL